MTIKEALQNTERVQFVSSSPWVVETAAREIVDKFPGADLQPVEVKHFDSTKGTFNISVRSEEIFRQAGIKSSFDKPVKQ